VKPVAKLNIDGISTVANLERSESDSKEYSQLIYDGPFITTDCESFINPKTITP